MRETIADRELETWVVVDRTASLDFGTADCEKRDIALASVAFIVLLPLMVFIALLVRLTSRGPVIFRQERCGLNGRKFTFYKFRSMCDNAEDLKSGLQHLNQRSTAFKIPNDPRLTPIGRYLRKFSIDEWPQLWNILRGDMNFVGPRPERAHFVKQLAQEVPFYEQRHLIAPGLTGWAQIKYPYGASVEDAREKLQYDLFYIKNQSLILDGMILFETIKTILFGRGQ